MKTAEVRIYDPKTGRLVERMGVEPVADAKRTAEWLAEEQKRTGETIRVRIVNTGNF